jgi:branched-chain amino acid transport system permease protein
MLRSINSYRMLIYSIVLIVMMIITSNEKTKTFISANTAKFKALFKREKVKEAE